METDSSLGAVRTIDVNVPSLKPSLALNIFSITYDFNKKGQDVQLIRYKVLQNKTISVLLISGFRAWRVHTMQYVIARE